MRKTDAIIIFAALGLLINGCAETGKEVRLVRDNRGNKVRVVKKREEKTRRNAPFKEPPAPLRVGPTQRPYSVGGHTYYPIPSAYGFKETGIASWYGRDFHGRKTSNGETYDMYAMTAAHKTLPINTMLLVKNLDNGRETMVRVNDRGPFVPGRIIDMSYAAAKKLGYVGRGTARVRIEAMAEAEKRKTAGAAVRLKSHPDFDRGEFFVQIGAFRNQSNAARLKKTMLTWGRKAVVIRGDLKGKPIFRVQVRAGTSLKKARHLERVLENSGFPTAFVIAR